MHTQVTAVVIGAGNRGTAYANFAIEKPQRLRIVGVAEPRDYYRKSMATIHKIPEGNVFKDWVEVARRSRFADAVIIATHDHAHVEPTLEFAKQGYHILLEKPMAPDEGGCRKIVNAVMENKIIFAVCHVLLYTNYTQTLRGILNSGAIGDVVSIQHLEPIGYWHYAHSYVRGNWRKQAESSFALLTKSCHDIDWIRYIVGERCAKVSSFGGLGYFKKEKKPASGGSRCVDCSCENDCAYSAKKIYHKRIKEGYRGWPIRIITSDLSERGVLQALETGPYGKCAFECDNDVVDSQVVNMLFEKGKTANFSMTAFTRGGIDRITSIFGTRGELWGNGSIITVYDFLTDETIISEVSCQAGISDDGHGGGDYGLMETFTLAVSNNDRSLILSGPDESLESHLIAFSAEEARVSGQVINLLDC